MEEILTNLTKDASTPKYSSIKKSAKEALDLLGNEGQMEVTAPHVLREKCLEPLQLALESKNKKLASFAVNGIQVIFKDERFQSSMELESEERWLPIQILNTVISTPSLSEDTQVEIMKLLLNMTFSTAWCMNAKVITKISQVYIDTYMTSTHSVKGAVKAALTQLLTSFTEKLHSAESKVVEDGNDVLADFNPTGNTDVDGLTSDTVSILHFFTQKLEDSLGNPNRPSAPSVPLLLEGVLTIISNCPSSISSHQLFQEIVWKNLCPALICLLGSPKSEKNVTSQKTSNKEDIGRGSGCSTSAPNLQTSTAKTIYSIAVSLVELMGPIGSLRPVLESLFHRMLLYPPPQHRLDALKAIKELLKSPDSLFNMAAPTIDTDHEEKFLKNPNADISLLKLIVDSLEECCHCNDSAVCITSVSCVEEMLGSLEQTCHGMGVTENLHNNMTMYYRCLSESGTSRQSSLSSVHQEADGGEEIEDVVFQQSENKASEDDITNGTQEEEPGQIMNQPNKKIRVRQHQHQVIREEIKKRCNQMGENFEEMEGRSAEEFVRGLENLIPGLGQAYSIYEVDEALQQFASSFCTALYERHSEMDSEGHIPILNADGVYVASVIALHLNLNLLVSGWYKKKNPEKPAQTEREFMDSVIGCGLLLFLSPSWLSEVYKQVCKKNLLHNISISSPLINLLRDIDGLGSHEKGGQLLSSYMPQGGGEQIEDVESFVKSGKMFARRVLSKCWSSVLEVLSVLLNGKSSCGITSSIALLLGTEGAKEESLKAREAICMSLNGLQKAARLCCTLGLQEYCGSVFYQLASTSCVILSTQRSPMLERKSLNKPPVSNKSRLVKLHASHILSMDVVMTTGLEMGSHSADCWKHLFRCSAFISELEHTYFSMGNNQSSLPKVQQEHTVECETSESVYPDETEFYTMPITTPVPVAPRINVTDLIKQSSIESGWEQSLTGGGVLNSSQSSQALCGLSQEVDRLFEEAASQLNLQALLHFLFELCESSQQQLLNLSRQITSDGHQGDAQLPLNALHLYRLQEVLMKVVHSERPLLHLMRAWSVVSSHLVECAGHKDRSVSRMAVTCVHDFILAVLSNRPELPYFHVNELLCKVLENMLCLEVCDGDVQDQIVCSICELVEACTADIKSGWRPLFGALRAVKIEYTANEEINDARQRHVAAVLDVFEVYLNTDNVVVFANATVDCILCLLKYVRGPGEFDSSSDEDSDSGSDVAMTTSGGENLCIPALGYLKKCSQILQTMWKMPACPVFNCAQRIQTSSAHSYVDSTLHHMNMGDFIKHYSEVDVHICEGTVSKNLNSSVQTDGKEFVGSESCDEAHNDVLIETGSLTSVDSGITMPTTKSERCSESKIEEKLQNDVSKSVCDNEKVSNQKTEKSSHNELNEKCKETSGEKHCETCMTLSLLRRQPGHGSSRGHYQCGTLDSIDNSSGILHVWYLLLDGLVGSVSSCPKTYQPETLQMLFELLKDTADVPGPEFALFCANSLLLPMIQTWLRDGSRRVGYWETGANNFKQCCGLCTDLVVDFVHKFSGFTPEASESVEIMLKQLYDILVECISQPAEIISRLGCSCIRHVMLSAGRSFTESMWQISAVAMETSLDVSTFHLRQIMLLFHVDSDNFYGDIAQVKVAMRRDSSPEECHRLRHLAHQVFLLDSQVAINQPVQDREEDKSFVFLMYKPGEDNSLNPDDIILRLPFRNVVVGLLANQLLLQTVGSVLLSPDIQTGVITEGKQSITMSAMLQSLSTRNVLKFLECLRNSYKLAVEFDSRPGLKFLIQKVARTEVGVNLYKQAGASMVFFIHTLIQICANIPHLSKETVKHSCYTEDLNLIDVCYNDSKLSSNTAKILSSPELFIQLLKVICDELCQTYVNILSDETSSRVDMMSEQQVFFLIAQPDDMSEIVGKQKKDLQKSKQRPDVAEDKFMTSAVPQQDEVYISSGDSSEGEEDQCVTSEPEQPLKSKRELREERDSKVYTIATDTLIKSLMTEYKKRKQAHAMPNFVKISKQTKEGKQKKSRNKGDQMDRDIDEQQKVSYMKDSEARIKSWTELLCTILQLFQQLSDSEFQSLLPAVFNCVNQLVCHAVDQRLRDLVGQLFYRLGDMLEITNSQQKLP